MVYTFLFDPRSRSPEDETRATCYLISQAVPKEELQALLGTAAFRRLVNRRQVGEKRSGLRGGVVISGC